MDRATAKKAVYKAESARGVSSRHGVSKGSKGHAAELGPAVKAMRLSRAPAEKSAAKARQFFMRQVVLKTKGSAAKGLMLPKLQFSGDARSTFRKGARARESSKGLAATKVTEEQPAVIKEVSPDVRPLRRGRSNGNIFRPDFLKKQDLRREMTTMDSPPTPPRPTERDALYMEDLH